MGYVKIPGIYSILNIVNNKIYIGYSNSINSRLNDHLVDLRNNKHKNEYLQRSYNKYGVNNFKFEILEECSEEYLASQENYWCILLDSHNRDKGYNIEPTSPHGKTKVSLETRLKQSKSMMGKNKGRKRTKESIEHFISLMIGKPNKNCWKAVIQFTKDNKKVKEWSSVTQAAKELDLSQGKISECALGIRKSHKSFIWKYK